MQAFDRIAEIIDAQNIAFKTKAEKEYSLIILNRQKIRDAVPETLKNAALLKEFAFVNELFKQSIELVRTDDALSIQQFTIWQNTDIVDLLGSVKLMNLPSGAPFALKFEWGIHSYNNLYRSTDSTMEVLLRRDGFAFAHYPFRIIGAKPSRINPFQVSNLDLYMDDDLGANHSSLVTEALLRAQMDALYGVVAYAMISREAYFDAHFFNLIYWLFEPTEGRKRMRISENWTWIQRGLALYFVDAIFTAAFPDIDFASQSYSSLGIMMVAQDDIPSLQVSDEELATSIATRLQEDLTQPKLKFRLNYWPGRIMKDAFHDIGLEGFAEVYRLSKHRANSGRSYDKAFKKAYLEVTQKDFDQLQKQLLETYKTQTPEKQ